jgi:hypothetical protein
MPDFGRFQETSFIVPRSSSDAERTSTVTITAQTKGTCDVMPTRFSSLVQQAFFFCEQIWNLA